MRPMIFSELNIGDLYITFPSSVLKMKVAGRNCHFNSVYATATLKGHLLTEDMEERVERIHPEEI